MEAENAPEGVLAGMSFGYVTAGKSTSGAYGDGKGTGKGGAAILIAEQG